MKKILFSLLALTSIILMVACDPTPIEETGLKSLYLDQSELILEVGETYQLILTRDPLDNTSSLTWESEDDAVASVSASGLITALSSGETVIRVSGENEITASVQVEVVDVIEDQETTLPINYNFNESIPSGINRAFSGGGFSNLEEGALHMGTIGTGVSMASIVFSEALAETTVIETRIKVGSTAFVNALFLYTSGNSVSDIVATVAFENGSIKYHSGSAWTNIMSYTTNTWYDIKMVLNIGSRSVSETKGDFDLYVNGTLAGTFVFRNGGDGYEDNIYRLQFGSDKANSDFSYDYLNIYYATKPTLNLVESSANLTLDSTSVDYQVLYQTTGDPVITINSEVETGYVVDGDVITFNAAGTYVFKVRATTGAGYVEKTLTIIVEGSIFAPQLSIGESSKTLLITQQQTYILNYEVTGGDPIPTVEITTTATSGYTRDGNVVTFSEVGIYEFIITATNSVGSISRSITVNVVDSNNFFIENFGGEPSYTVAKTGSGNITFTDEKLNVTTGLDSGSAFLHMPFAQTIGESFMISETVTVRSNTFSNVLFLYGNNGFGTTDIAIGIAVESGTIRNHNGTSWNVVPNIPNVLNETFELTLYVNVETAQFEIFVDQVSYGTLPFRNANLKDQITHLYLGSDKVNADFSVDDIQLAYILAPSLELENEIDEVDIDVDPIYVVNYTVSDEIFEPSVIITGPNTPGYSIDHTTITFTNLGTFEFTVVASNGYIETVKTLTITVIGSNFAPIILVNQVEKDLNLDQENSYTLNYELVTGNPEPVVVIESLQNSGFSLDGDVVTFTETGIYEFIITATNSIGTDSKQITVNVMSANTVMMESFNQPRDYVFDKTGAGSVSYENQNLHLTTGLAPNSVFINLPFGEVLQQSFTIEQTVLVGHTAFSNVLFIYGNNSNLAGDIAVAVAIENGILRYHDGSWKAVPGYDAVIDQTLALKLFVDIDLKLVDLYIDGVYVMSFGFRNAAISNQLTHLRLGSDKQDSDITIDNIIVTYIDSPTISLGDNAEIFDMDLDPVYPVLYTASEDVVITGEAVEGYFINGDEITFTLPGVYTFTLTASNGYIDTTEQLIIEVTSAYYAPSITINDAIVGVDLTTNNTYMLDYSVDANPTASIEISVDQETGFSLDDNTLTFTLPGVYVVTITATNLRGEDSDIVTITVSDSGYAPTVTLSETETSIDLATQSEYVLNYTVDAVPTPTIEISVDQVSGFSRDGDVITFETVGVYEVTVTATNSKGSHSDSITITVIDTNYAPIVTANESEVEVDLTLDNEVTLNYSVDASPLASIEYLVSPETGFDQLNDTFNFYEVGVYTITVTATNDKGSDSEIITITVVESAVVDHEFTYEFDVLPEASNLTLTNGGTANVVDGNLVLQTGAVSGRALYGGTFERNLTGTVVAETRVKISAPVFTNLLLLYSGTSNVLGIAVQDGTIRYHNGSTWFNSNIAVPLNEFFEIKTVTVLGSGKFTMYVDGVKYADLSLRTKGAAESTINRFASHGIDNRIGQTMEVDYFRVYNLSPDLTLTPVAYEVVLTISNQITIDFELRKGLETTYQFSSLQETGWSSNEKVLTFTEVGSYQMTLTATNVYGSQSINFEVEVQLGDTDPELTILESSGTVDLASASHSYTMLYETNITNPISIIDFSVDLLSGYSMDGNVISFTEEGVYTITVTYTNENSEATGEIIVTVTKSAFTNTIMYDTFDMSGDLSAYTVTTTGTGSVGLMDGVLGADGGVLSIITGATTGSGFVDMPFSQSLTGTIITETRIMVGSTSFSNAIFFYGTGTTIVAPIAFDAGLVRYHDGSWKSSGFAYTINTWYQVKMVMDIEAARYDLYIDNVFIGNYGFRTPSAKNDISKFRNGADKVNADMKYDYIVVYEA